MTNKKTNNKYIIGLAVALVGLNFGNIFGDILGSAIGLVIGVYFLFEIRSQFNGATVVDKK